MILMDDACFVPHFEWVSCFVLLVVNGNGLVDDKARIKVTVMNSRG